MKTLGSIDGWKALVFRSFIPGSPHFYVVMDSRMDYLDFMHRYDDSPISTAAQYKQCDGANLDENDYPFWAVYCEDCFYPPIAIVRAENESDAIDIAVDAFAWLRVSPEDYGPDFAQACEDGTVGFADGGHLYDGESLQVRSIKLFQVEME